VNSTEKVHAAIDRAEAVADDQTAAFEVQAAAGMMSLARGHIARLLPEEPAELDALLSRGAEWLLSLRSDDAPEMRLLMPAPHDG
jgi:hypothetical protein